MGSGGLYDEDPFLSVSRDVSASGVAGLLVDWRRRATESQAAHYETAKHLARMHYLLGVPVIGLTTLVGTAIFATLEQEGGLEIRIALGLISVAAAIVAAIQTFLRFAERAEKHRAAGAGFGALRREIEHQLVLESADPSQDDLSRIRARYDDLAQSSPEIPHRIWERLHAR